MILPSAWRNVRRLERSTHASHTSTVPCTRCVCRPGGGDSHLGGWCQTRVQCARRAVGSGRECLLCRAWQCQRCLKRGPLVVPEGLAVERGTRWPTVPFSPGHRPPFAGDRAHLELGQARQVCCRGKETEIGVD